MEQRPCATLGSIALLKDIEGARLHLEQGNQPPAKLALGVLVEGAADAAACSPDGEHGCVRWQSFTAWGAGRLDLGGAE